jgi:hypothetical protein
MKIKNCSFSSMSLGFDVPKHVTTLWKSIIIMMGLKFKHGTPKK